MKIAKLSLAVMLSILAAHAAELDTTFTTPTGTP